jgi:hypothetical protein
MSSEADTRSRSEQPKRAVRLVLTALWDERSAAFELAGNDAIVFGRGESCELRVDHPSVSRRHARFHAGQPVMVEDLHSRNGTIVRGTPLAVQQSVPVKPGDVIECGDVLLLLRTLSIDGATAELDAPVTELIVGAGGRWFQPIRGERINLGRRGPLRRVLLSLAKQRLSQPGIGVNVQALIAAGWPGEKILHKAGLARAYTTIQRLRALGLQGVLLTTDEGYLLHPNLPIRIEEG